ncbi:Ribonuclease III domain [Sesbania bispinosa]|nr:Ribonuclease III domain [Sesbania bispinosa]
MILDAEFDYSKAVDLGYISPKLHELIKLFQTFGESSQVLCLIFVERIITAKVIERFVKKVSQISHFTVSYLTGNNTSVDALAPKRQKEILDSFRSGKVNLLFTTDVLEEGIHVPNCSCVIRFDLPKTVCSYVQSRGRSRQANSQFILMLERGNLKQRNQLFDIIRSERSMTDAAINKDHESNLRAFTVEKTNAYHVDSTGASVTLDSSVTLINKYCEKLPRDKYSCTKPTFEFLPMEGCYQCKLILPPNAAFQTIIGPSGKDVRLARNLVCLEACKKLHQMGALNEHLVPSIEDPSEADHIVKNKDSSSGAGTTKRKELHGTTSIRSLCGTWDDKLDGAKFHAYKFEFTCNIVSEIYSGFVLLMESKLDDDVGNIELDLYLVSKTVKASVSSCGQVDLDAEQMMKAKCFHELFFNGLFGKLVLRSKSAKGEWEFLLQKDTKLLWSPKNLYLLLPLEKFRDISKGSLQIHWSGINSCASAIEFLRRKFSLVAGDGADKGKITSPCDTSSSHMEYESAHEIHFANCVVNINNLKNMVVLAIHTGKIYCIIEVVTSLSAESPFDGNNEKSGAECITFSNYFNKRYGITLRHPGQPLLRLKQSHNPHNLFLNFHEEDAGDKSSQIGPVNPKMPAHVHMPPELLCLLNVKRDVLKSMYLLPSMMYRIESFMLSSQLREEINGETSSFNISSSLRLELLGDSILKYAVSCHLFLKYPKKHEGQLSARRQSAVRNSTLHKLGTDRKLQGYIRDSAFEPRRWVAPGQRSIHPVSCDCGLETLEVPLDVKFHTEDPKVVVGKLCDRGHRWMCSKTIADCVEALIGAYYVGGGLVASLHVMKWLGIDSELEPSMVDEAITAASLHTYMPKVNEIASLERKLDMNFLSRDSYWRQSHICLGQNLGLASVMRVISESENNTISLPSIRAPKALGDLVESIAGAILIDTKLNLDEVWKVFNPLLSPIVTPDKLELPPLRELNQLCDSLGNGGFHMVVACPREKRDNPDHISDSSHLKRDFSLLPCQTEEHSSEPVARKRPKLDEANLTANTSTGFLPPKDCSSEATDCSPSIPVITSINMKKGGPRTTLYELCKRLQWPLPAFDSTEYKDRTLFESCEGLEGSKGQNCFVAKITLCIPNDGDIKCQGDARSDKKSSYDSAAVEMLYELQRLGKLEINVPQ